MARATYVQMRKHAIKGVVAIYGLADGGEDVPESNMLQGVNDLLSDLALYCKREGIDFKAATAKVLSDIEEGVG